MSTESIPSAEGEKSLEVLQEELRAARVALHEAQTRYEQASEALLEAARRTIEGASAAKEQ